MPSDAARRAALALPAARGLAPRLVAGVAAVVALHLALILPNHPDAATWGAFGVAPLELPAILLGLVLATRPAGRIVRGLAAGALTLTVALKTLDLASNLAFDRPFNPLLDLHLAPAGWRLLSGAVGTPPALAAAAALILGLALVAGALWWATGRIAALAPPPRTRAPLGLALAAAVTLVAADAAREVSPWNPPGAAFTARLAWEHGRDVVRARADLAAFRVTAAEDPLADLPPEAILPALRGSDVLLIFVESYGRSALEGPEFAPAPIEALTGLEPRLAAAGLAMRSGWLTSTTLGGQSWLAHASLLAGLRVDDQGRYRALFSLPRRTLIGAAGDAGWRTVAVMPAITFAWPEASWFGYDRVLAAADLGYAGPPFGWVTMPDQFALAAFERAELDPTGRPPVFAEIALTSSHAPFTPIPPLLPWASLGDGAVFADAARAGPSPEALWSDLDRLGDQFGRALAYSLGAVGGFAERRAADAPLMIVLGDHEPAALVSGDGAGRDVPVHVIGPPDRIARLDGWGWTPGLIPAPDAPVWPMEDFRARLLSAFGEE